MKVHTCDLVRDATLLSGRPQLNVVGVGAVGAGARDVPDGVVAGATLGVARPADKVLIVPDLDLHRVADDVVSRDLSVHADARHRPRGQRERGGCKDVEKLHGDYEMKVECYVGIGEKA